MNDLSQIPALNELPQIPAHQLLRRIGEGSYGEIWLGQNVLGTWRAIKVVYRDKFDHDRPYEREFNGIKKFEPVSRSHPGLVDVLQVGRDDAAGYFYYVMELADDIATGQQISPGTYEPKTLAVDVRRRKPLPFDVCLQFALSLTAAAGHLHKHGLIHRDIKPSNIIFVNGVPKLADIGLVTDVDTKSIPGGTLGYIAPEGIPSPRADIYSVGKVLYELATGKDRQEFPEYPEPSTEQAAENRFRELTTVITKACQASPDKRYESAQELQSDLLLLQGGKSIRRLHVLESRIAFARRAGLVTVGLLLVAVAAWYQSYRSKQATTRRLAASYVGNSTRAVQEGDVFGSLSWLAEALRLESGSSREEQHRIALTSTLRHCPRLARLHVFPAHIDDLQLTADGKSMLIAARDNSVILWDLDKSATTQVYLGHIEPVTTAIMSRDGRFVLTASSDKTARVWDATTGRQIHLFSHPKSVHAAAINRQGNLVATACADSVVRIWELPAGRLKHELKDHNAAVRGVAFSPDDQYLLSTGEDGDVQVRRTDAFSKAAIVITHRGQPSPRNWVYGAEFSPDSRYIASAGFDKVGHVLDRHSGKTVTLWHKQAVRRSSFSPDSRLVVTACWDNTARIWDVQTGEQVLPPLVHESYVTTAIFAADGYTVVTATKNGIVRFWDLTPHYWLPPATSITASADGARFATATNGVMEIWKSGPPAVVIATLPTNVINSDYVFSQDGERLLTLSKSGTGGDSSRRIAQVWEAATGKSASKPFEFGWTSHAFSCEGRYVLGFEDARAAVYDALTGKVLSSMSASQRILAGVFAPGGDRVVLVAGSVAQVWDIKARKLLFELSHEYEVKHAAFNSDGSRLVTACDAPGLDDSYAQIWDTATGNQVADRLQHTDGILHAAFSPNGKWVATSSQDKTAKVWDSSTGKLFGQPLLHGVQVVSASFSADSRLLVTACAESLARIWDVETSEPVTPPLRHFHSGRITHAQFFGNQWSVLTVPRLGETRLWQFPTDLRSAEDFRALAQLLCAGQNSLLWGEFVDVKRKLGAMWHDLHARYPSDFQAPPEQALLWYQRAAELSEQAENWSGAVFNLNQLVKLQPDNAALVARRDRAQAALDKLSPPSP